MTKSIESATNVLPVRYYLSKKHPPVNFDQLAQMLEIDLLLGRPKDFRLRLKRSLFYVAKLRQRKTRN